MSSATFKTTKNNSVVSCEPNIKQVKEEFSAKKKQLAKSEKRIEELDRLFQHVYEDNVNGKISDDRFQMLSESYEKESLSKPFLTKYPKR